MQIFTNAKQFLDDVLTGKKSTISMWVPFGKAKVTADPELINTVLKQPRNMLGSRVSRWLIAGNSTAVLDYDVARERRKLFDFVDKKVYSRFAKAALTHQTLDGEVNYYDVSMQAVRYAYFKEVVGVDPSTLDFSLLDNEPSTTASLKKLTGAMLVPEFLYRWYFKSFTSGRTQVREFAQQILSSTSYTKGLWLDRLKHSGLSDSEQFEEILSSVSNTHALALGASWAVYCYAKYQHQYKEARPFMYETFRMYPVAHLVPTETKCPVQKTKKFFISLQGLHRSSAYTNPNDFDANRFSAGIQQYAGSYLPFGAGTRKCLGSGITVVYCEALLDFIHNKYTVSVIEEAVPKRRFLLEFDNNRLLLKFGKK